MIKPFVHAHATHPDGHMALALAAAQIEAQRAASGLQPTLGWLYLSDLLSGSAASLLDEARQRWPGVAWVGAAGPGICASGVEYFDEPALALMLAELPPAQFRLFHGRQPLAGWPAELAQVHVGLGTPELQELIAELAAQTGSGYLFGGMAVGRQGSVQIADGVWPGGLSGVAFALREARVVSRVSQGCQALGPERRITACEGSLVQSLDGRPALDCLLQDLALPVLAEPRELRDALPRLRRTLVGLSAADAADRSRREYGPEVRVRHLVGLDPAQRGVAIAERPALGQRLSFCHRNPEAARRDLLRICTEIRAEAEERGARMLGAVYISCSGRGGPHFGAPSAEALWVQHGLGAELPMVGLFAGGEIAHASLYGYTGVLSVFLDR